ncbi:hypothetical protein BGP_2632 [Beggiatoa sp. PS]|nr:hypothetical protein BGP_2632 [Beggiatoa sp. PS]
MQPDKSRTQICYSAVSIITPTGTIESSRTRWAPGIGASLWAPIAIG